MDFGILRLGNFGIDSIARNFLFPKAANKQSAYAHAISLLSIKKIILSQTASLPLHHSPQSSANNYLHIMKQYSDRMNGD